MSGLRLALTTLTVLPVGGPARLDRQTAGRAMLWAPAVGVLLALLLAPLLVAVDRSAGGLLAAALAVAGLALLTRGLHLDGLADLADGLGSAAPPERAREVMKAPDVGALGVAAVVLVVVVQVAALAACASAGSAVSALVLAAATGRLAVTSACRWDVPAATTTGLGALVAGTVRLGRTTALAGAVVVAGAVALSLEGTRLTAAVPVSLAAVVFGLAAAALLRRHAVRRVGGVTGDVLGALVEVTTAVVLVVVAVAA